MGTQLRRAGQGFLKHVDFLIDLLVALATIVIAVGTFVYSIIGRAATQVISSGTLAILALLAYSVLRNRQTDQTIIVSLDDLARALPARSLAAYASQDAAYKMLETYVASQRVKRAVLFQYSGIKSTELMKTLLANGARVTVYVQDEQTAALIGSEEQRERVVYWRRWLRGELASDYDLSKLEVRKFSAPASVRAASITMRDGTKILCLGWYLYEDVRGAERPQNRDYSQERVEVSGHDVAAVVVWQGAEGFDALYQTFNRLEEHYVEHSEAVHF